MQQTMAVSKNAFPWKTKVLQHKDLRKHSAVDIFIPIDHNCDTAFPSSNIMSSRTNSFHQLLSDILMILLIVSVFIDLYSMSYVWESHSSWAEKGTSGGNQYIIPFTLNHAPPLILWWCSAALLDHFAANFRGLQRNVPCLTRCNLNRAPSTAILGIVSLAACAAFSSDWDSLWRRGSTGSTCKNAK